MMNLRKMKVDDLKDIARGFSCTGAWKMTKDQLIASILRNAELNDIHDYCDGDPELEPTKIPEGYEATKIDGTVVMVSRTIQDDTESAELEDVITNEVEENATPVSAEREEVTAVEHTQKKKRGKLLEFNGKSQTLGDWSKELGIAVQTLYNRLYNKNMPIEEAFTAQIKKRGTKA